MFIDKDELIYIMIMKTLISQQKRGKFSYLAILQSGVPCLNQLFMMRGALLIVVCLVHGTVGQGNIDAIVNNAVQGAFGGGGAQPFGPTGFTGQTGLGQGPAPAVGQIPTSEYSVLTWYFIFFSEKLINMFNYGDQNCTKLVLFTLSSKIYRLCCGPFFRS